VSSWLDQKAAIRISHRPRVRKHRHPHHRSRRRGWWLHLILLSVYFLYPSVTGLGTPKPHPAVLHGAASRLLYSGAWEMLYFGIIFGLAFLASRPTPDSLLLRWRGVLSPVGLGALYAVLLPLIRILMLYLMFMMLAYLGLLAPHSLLDIAAAHHSGVERIVSEATLRDDRWFFWTELTVGCFLLAALPEELWRSAMLAGLKALWPRNFSSRVGQGLAVAIVSVFFGVAHGIQGPVAMLQAGWMGFALGLIMVYHRSIWPAVITHGLLNATTSIIIVLDR